jgi:hypothetical protein
MKQAEEIKHRRDAMLEGDKLSGTEHANVEAYCKALNWVLGNKEKKAGRKK